MGAIDAGDIDCAIAHFEVSAAYARRDDKLKEFVHRSAGAALLSAGAAAHAVRHFLALARRRPDDRRAICRLLAACRRSGDTATEAIAWRMLLCADPHCLKAHIRLAEVRDEADMEAALPHLRAACALRPSDKGRLKRLAAALRALGQDEHEIAALSKLVSAGSRDWEIIRRLAELLISRGDAAGALRLLQDTPCPTHRVERAQLIANTLESSSASREAMIAGWRAVVAEDSDDLRAHERLTYLLTADGSWAEAVSHLGKVAQSRPDDPLIARSFARALDAAEECAEKCVAAWRNVLLCDKACVEAHARLAELLEASDPGRAIVHVQALTSCAPTDVSLWRRLADLHQKTGDQDGEIEARRKLVELNVGDAAAHRRLAEIFLEGSDAECALLHLSSVAEPDAADKSLWEALARLLQESDTTGAIEAWRRAATFGPLEVESGMRAARLCAVAGQAEVAVQFLKNVLEVQPNHKKAVKRFGELLFDQNRVIDAAPFLARAVENHPMNLRLARKNAWAQRKCRALEGEISAWRHVLTLRPDDNEAHRRLGDLFFGMKRHREAAKHLERALELAPSDQRLMRRLVKAFSRAGDTAGELRALERLNALAPLDASMRQRVAELLQAQGRHEGAIEHLKGAIDYRPKDPQLWRLLYESHARLDNREGSRAALSSLLKLEPANADAHRQCGELLFEEGAYAKAEIHLRAAARAFPRNAELQILLATCFRRLERRTEETRALQRLVELNEGDADTHRRLGEILHAQGASDGALVHLRRSLDERPDDPYCIRLLAEALTVADPAGRETTDAWKRVLELDPEDNAARRALADAFLAAKHYEDADTIYATLTDHAGDDPTYWKQWARAARALRGRDGEIAVLSAAIEGPLGASRFAYALSALLIEANRSGVIEMMRNAWSASPDSSQFAILCRKLEEAHRVDEALTCYQMLVREAPDACNGWTGHGEILERMGHHREAAVYLARAFEISGVRAHRKQWLRSLLNVGAFETVERNCQALDDAGLTDQDLRLQHALALAGLGRFDDALHIAKEGNISPDWRDREGFLHYLRIRSLSKSTQGAYGDETLTPVEQMFRKAEARQVRGDLRGASQLYRAGGAALRRCIAQRNEEGVEVCGPDFLIIGAPRSGSSWLKNCLKRHPQFRVALGEPGYFSSFAHFSPATYAKCLSCVKPTETSSARAGVSPIFGEKTPDYLTMDDDAIELCAALYPDIKLICLIRDPVLRAWSHLKHRRLAAGSSRFYTDEHGQPTTWLCNILEFGRYRRHLQRWARHFPSKQFLLVDFNRLTASPKALLDEVQEFLGATRIGLTDLLPRAEKLRGATSHHAPSGEVEALLTEFYANETHDVATLRNVVDQASLLRSEATIAA